jgi:transcriptional regulator of heat shock response
MDPRLQQLLRLVLQEYVASAEPVGSQYLVDRYTLEVSPATVRNWFAELDELGFLEQPHTSGGRIPTEAAFKQFVDEMLPKPAPKRARDRFEAVMKAGDEHKLRAIAGELANLTGLASIVAGEDETYFTGLSQLLAQPEFRNWEKAIHLTALLEHLDETLSGLKRVSFDEPIVLLGEDCPFGPACGAIVAKGPNNTLIGVLGPVRMDYQQAMSHLVSALEVLNA